MSDGFILSSVKWFNRDKGYGFLKGTGDGLDVFVHANQLRKSGIETALVEGEQVKFKIESGAKGKYAVNISKVDQNGNAPLVVAKNKAGDELAFVLNERHLSPEGIETVKNLEDFLNAPSAQSDGNSSNNSS